MKQTNEREESITWNQDIDIQFMEVVYKFVSKLAYFI